MNDLISEKISYLDMLMYELCDVNGVSGREDLVRYYIIDRLPKGTSYRIDAMGNLIVSKKGKKTPKNKLMICAHMDEVGFIITYITEEGYLKFDTLGGIDPAVIIGKTVTLESGAVGVIGLKHIHLSTGDDRNKLPPVTKLCIDIGAHSKAEAEQYASLGDYAVFNSDQECYGTDGNFIKAKALDDRVGCALMIDLINKALPYDVEFAFTVQEEVGARGALAATYGINPDYAIVLETTTAGDICGVTGEKRACILGNGPVISYMDRGTVYDHDLYQKMMKAAKDKGVPAQTKTLIAGGNDSSSVQRTGNGVKTLAVSVPCRYLHSPSCVINKRDVAATQKLLEVFLEEIFDG